jgi:DNA-binding transcriptional ArsR family regulator
MMTTVSDDTDLRTKLDLTAKLFRGFADPSRLAILLALRDGERCVSDLVIATGLTQSNVSGHLTCLRDCGLVVSRQEGRFVHYRLADPAVAEVLDSAGAVLSRHAERIAACVNYEPDGRTPDRD